MTSTKKISRPITLASNGGLWQAERRTGVFTWVYLADLPPQPSRRERLASLIAELPLSPRQHECWAAVVEKASAQQVAELLARLEKLTPAQQWRLCAVKS